MRTIENIHESVLYHFVSNLWFFFLDAVKAKCKLFFFFIAICFRVVVWPHACSPVWCVMFVSTCTAMELHPLPSKLRIHHDHHWSRLWECPRLGFARDHRDKARVLSCICKVCEAATPAQSLGSSSQSTFLLGAFRKGAFIGWRAKYTAQKKLKAHFI